MQANTLTAGYCGLSPVRIQEALFIGRSYERFRRFQEVVDAIQKKEYNVPECFTDEPPEIHTLQERNITIMKINQDTVNGIIENAKAVNGLYKELCRDANFKERFHLRPIGDRITIVSTLSCAPMWGLSVEKQQLEGTLEKLGKAFKTICSVTRETVLKGLKDVGYDIERKTESPNSEAAVQAKFIQGLLAGQPDYEGIEFVASELSLGKESKHAKKTGRFDVVGLKGDTLYVFELKKDRTTKVEQVVDYVALINANKEHFRNVLSVYPNRAVGDWDKVQGVMVMSHAVNVTKEIGKKAKENGVELWYFEPAIRFVEKV
jgi:Holliday junction resolvase